MDFLFVWEMQCEFIIVNTLHMKQALGEMQKQGLTRGLKLEPENVPFLSCTRMKNHPYFLLLLFQCILICLFLLEQ